jgi:hypothetical protein
MNDPPSEIIPLPCLSNVPEKTSEQIEKITNISANIKDTTFTL